MGLGWVPLCVQGVEWTTPALISGYMATGSWAGVVLQIVNIAIGVGIYAPFVLLYDKILIRQSQRQMHARFPQRESFCRFLCQFCAHVKPQLCVMDAVEGMQGNGPSGGDRYDGQRLLAALDPFALDYGALTLLGIDPDQTPIHREAVKLGLVDPEAIELIAPEESWESLIRHDFRLPETMKGLIQLIPSPLAALRRHFAPYPKPDASRCLGCGDCVRDCPVQAITLVDHKAVVNRRRCIRCYCCQEVCPVHVVQLKR